MTIEQNITAAEIDAARRTLIAVADATDGDKATAIMDHAARLLADERDKAVASSTATTGVWLQPLLDQAIYRVAQMRGEFEAGEMLMRIARERFGLCVGWSDALIIIALYRTERPDALFCESSVAMDMLQWFFSTYANQDVAG
jgi:hypothetical protein